MPRAGGKSRSTRSRPASTAPRPCAASDWNLKGHKFRRQVPIGRYIADFVCHEARLILEIDGGQHDRSSPQEAERNGFLQNQGYRILRFWNNEVLANLDGVHATIAGELGRLTPTQTLPHREGGLQGENNVHSNDTEGGPA